MNFIFFENCTYFLTSVAFVCQKMPASGQLFKAIDIRGKCRFEFMEYTVPASFEQEKKLSMITSPSNSSQIKPSSILKVVDTGLTVPLFQELSSTQISDNKIRVCFLCQSSSILFIFEMSRNSCNDFHH